MSIRLKIILIVLPLIVASIVLAGMSSYFVAAQAVTRVTTEFLSFKASELEKYAEGQWNLLAENGLVGRPDMETAARAAVESFARSILRSPTEAIIALDSSGNTVMLAGPVEPKEMERGAMSLLAAKGERGFGTFKIGGVDRVASYFPFRSFGWLVLVTEVKSVFYGDVESIFRSSLAILAGAAALAIFLLLVLARYITKPIETVSLAMRRIIASNDLTERVDVEYNDEIGQLSHTFNLMLGELGKAYDQIKRYAFDAVVAQKKEAKIRNIFQLYVPKDVIETYFQNPESMLVGNNRPVAVLFSDIRSFTTISEGMEPDDLVSSLNRYFALMVDTIMERGGVVDKYIGDAIMAMFGAPTKHEDDCLRAVLAGMEMSESLEVFNMEQRERGKPPFRIGIGINYGVVTVGNIGCEKKMNYTLIGDPVNLASRLEGATKMYKQPILFSHDVYERVKGKVHCRLVDTIQVKGKTAGVRVYTARTMLGAEETRVWALSEKAIEAYYHRDFAAAERGFCDILSIMPEDYPASLFLERSRAFLKNPPAKDWDGVEVLTEK
jgi:adenylate cyclase